MAATAGLAGEVAECCKKEKISHLIKITSCAGVCKATYFQSSLQLTQVCIHEYLCVWSKCH